MKKAVTGMLHQALIQIGVSSDIVPDVSISEDASHGEYTSNIAMRLAKSLKKSPMDIALQVQDKLKTQIANVKAKTPDQKMSKQDQKKSSKQGYMSVLQDIDRVEVVAPGFINVFLTEAKLSSEVSRVLKEVESYGKSQTLIPLDLEGEADTRSKRIMVEFAHPNTHKAFHIGHLRNITTGESIVRMLEAAGYEVIRANYQGDVGMHIAKALYGLLELFPYKDEYASVTGTAERVAFLGRAYAAGSQAFEEDEAAKAVIKDYNYLVYASAEQFAEERGLPKASTDYLSFVQGDKGRVKRVYEVWKETRQWSLDYFETIYSQVGSHFDRYYFESECLSGVDKAKEAVKQGILEESNGAIIFNGKPYGVDTRVFVNSLGLPTYEGKELALASMESTEHGELAHIIHCVGPEQSSFFQVTFKAEERIGIIKPGVQHHLAYGWVKLKHGKMSSRTGQVVLGEWLIEEAKKSIYKILDQSRSEYAQEEKDDIAQKGAIAAIKYGFLRVGINQTIAFDLKESVSFDGDSGPYLLYTYARCRSVLRKASGQPSGIQSLALNSKLSFVDMNAEERTLARLIHFFPEIVADAAQALSPNMLCGYLFKLAQTFNLFYQKHAILGEQKRLALTEATAQVLKNGLYLLGIGTVERM